MGNAPSGDLASLDLRAGNGFTLIRIKATPKASRDEVLGVAEGLLRIRLQAPPVDGAANERARIFLAGLLGRPRAAVVLVRGQTSREKTFRIDGLDPQAIRGLLGAHLP